MTRWRASQRSNSALNVRFQTMAMTEAATAMAPEAPAPWPMAMKSRLETAMAMSSYRMTKTTRRRGPCRPVGWVGMEDMERSLCSEN